MPYWAELWPSGVGLAEALPDDLVGLTVVELGCGLGVPSLVAAARGARVTAVDWAADAIDLLRRIEWATTSSSTPSAPSGARSRAPSTSSSAPTSCTRSETDGHCSRCSRHSRRACSLPSPGCATAAAFFEDARDAWEIAEAGERVYELRRATRGDPPAHGHG